jgi:hypothetical protein
MARYAKVDVRIWDDERVSGMTPIPPCGQGLWIRLLVSRHRSAIPGLLCVGEAALAEEFGWSLEAFREAFREASANGLAKADWKARLIWLPKACRYNAPESPNVVKSWRVPWDEAPECALKREAFHTLKAFMEGFGEGFRLAFAKACGKAMPNQEQDPEQEQEQERGGPLSAPKAKIQPRNPHDLEHCMRVAIERAQPQAGRWLPGRFSTKDADKFFRDLGDVETALPEIERKIQLFADDPDMQPWLVAKFVDNFMAIGQPKLEFGRAPKAGAQTQSQAVYWPKA